MLRQVVTHLLRNFTGSSPFAADNTGFTPLHYASSYGHKMAVQMLLDYAPGDKLSNAASNTKTTPLHLAVSGTHSQIPILAAVL